MYKNLEFYINKQEKKTWSIEFSNEQSQMLCDYSDGLYLVISVHNFFIFI